jgi:hypothetical protein
MSINQVILWGMFIVPWQTLLFMKKEDMKRFMPAALFAIVTGMLIEDMGVARKLWEIKENIYPLNELIPYTFGVFPVSVMWFLKFTFGRFWLYAIIETIMSIVFAYLIQPWLSNRGIRVLINATSFKALLPAFPHFTLIYLYQMWQEGIFARSKRTSFSANVQTVAAKPLPNNHDKQTEKE